MIPVDMVPFKAIIFELQCTFFSTFLIESWLFGAVAKC